ncbi:MAG: flagellar biosynthetic protein FliO [Oceanococcus sp.]|nr:MAG: flagellar biosynthetic protein FliO [Oceanococcus sp.]
MDAASVAQMLGSLIAVVLLIFACAWLAKRMPIGGMARSDALKIEASVAVGTRERVVMLRAADTYLVLGVAPGQVRTLHVLDAPPQNFREVLAEHDENPA